MPLFVRRSPHNLRGAPLVSHPKNAGNPSLANFATSGKNRCSKISGVGINHHSAFAATVFYGKKRLPITVLRLRATQKRNKKRKDKVIHARN
jgi:hypothetical protein